MSNIQKPLWDNPYKPKLVASKDNFHLALSHIDMAAVSCMPMPFPYVKDFMQAILPAELLLVGAKTGAGKTEFLTQMALNWGTEKRVGFIALEAEPEEIELRILFKLISRAYIKDQARDQSVRLDFRSWRLGRLPALDKYRDTIYPDYLKKVENLYVYYMQKSSFTVADLIDLMDDVKANCDVCIIDHLHYFDMIGSRNDMEGMKSLMKRIRQLNLESRIPFVCAAHLRKDVGTVMPSLDDFMGSSDISKIATSAILIAKKPDGYNARTHTSTTLFSIPKLRGGGGTHFLGEIDFSVKHQEYVPIYTLSVQNFKGDRLIKVEQGDYPDWAKKTDRQWEIGHDIPRREKESKEDDFDY